MSEFDERPTYADDELRAEFVALFPHGWAGPDVMADLAPAGWAASPLAAVFHPSAERVYEEQVRMHHNLANFPARKPDAPPPPPPPTREEVMAEFEETPVEPEIE